MIRGTMGAAVALLLAINVAWGRAGLAQGSSAFKVQRVLETPPRLELKFGGLVGQRLKANLENWELRAPDSNPALIEMFYDRERQPGRASSLESISVPQSSATAS